MRKNLELQHSLGRPRCSAEDLEGELVEIPRSNLWFVDALETVRRQDLPDGYFLTGVGRIEIPDVKR